MSVKKVNGKGNSKRKIFLLLTIYYEARTFLFVELYFVWIASRHVRFFQKKFPVVLIDMRPDCRKSNGQSVCFFSSFFKCNFNSFP